MPGTAKRVDAEGTPKARFGKDARVRRRSEYRFTQTHGRRVHTPSFILLVAEQTRVYASARVGITVTKKVGNAVARNRIKRVVREVFRRNRECFPPGFDYVFIAKAGAEAIGYADLLAQVRAIEHALARAARPKGTENK